MTRTVKAPPRASALIESMRDIGYSIETAISDIIDNSLTAGGTRIEILSHFHGSESAIGILDNGHGMTEVELIEAMRPGSQSPTEQRDENDLGRFGLGLKTASYSQCRRVTVLSSRSGVRSVARWDLDHVVRTDDWNLELPDSGEGVPFADRLEGDGTLVVWEKLDRVLGDEFEHGEAEFNQSLDLVRSHVALVFHRFLAGSHGTKRTRIALNGTPIEPFDPFHSSHSATQRDPVEPFRIGDTKLSLQTYTLPHHGAVSRSDWEQYAGADGYVKNQGFYVFRGHRLIVHGTWFGLMRQTELTKLTRVAVDLPNRLDAEWKIDVKKASAQPPAALRKRLRKLTETLGSSSRRAFRHRGNLQTPTEKIPFWRRRTHEGQISYVIDTEHPAVSETLGDVDADTRKAIESLLSLAAATLPLQALHHDVSNSPQDVLPAGMPEDEFEAAVRSTALALLARTSDGSLVREMMRVQPFTSAWDRTEQILRDALGDAYGAQ